MCYISSKRSFAFFKRQSIFNFISRIIPIRCFIDPIYTFFSLAHIYFIQIQSKFYYNMSQIQQMSYINHSVKVEVT